MINVIVSWFIVAFGQPAWLAWLSPLAACAGYAVFWKTALTFSSPSRRFWLALFWFAAVQAIQLSWMTAIEFQGLYILFVYGALCLALGAQFGLLTLAVNRIPHIAVAALWTIFEWSRLYFFCGFSWNPSGLALTSYPVTMQLASVFGVFGLSFLVVLTNIALFKKKVKVWAALTAIPYLFGWAHLAYHENALKTSPTLSVGLVQTGLLPSQKIPMKERKEEYISPYEQWERILTALKEKKQKFDLIVLPEYVVPFSAEAPLYSAEAVVDILAASLGKESLKEIPTIGGQEKLSNAFWGQSIANAFSAEVVAGLDAKEEKHHYAAAFHFIPHRSHPQRYEKQILVPLAEYIPYQWLRQFTEKYGIFEFFTHGKESKVFQGKVPLSISICYEETFSHLIRQGRAKGAELLVNVTNDNWYPSSNLPLEHFVHARVRAVENGVPLVRACNTAVTAAVDSLGRILGQITDEQTMGVLAANVPTYHYFTLYILWGNFGIMSLCLFFLVLSWFLSRKSPRV
jgi:apolipoprotein N-acyltransferase